jgi:polyhydroxyalkanoate synthesis regulator phasin
MINLEESKTYAEEMMRQIEEYRNNKNLTKREAGIALYMKADLFAQFGIMTPKDSVKVSNKIIEVFGLDEYEMEQLIF